MASVAVISDDPLVRTALAMMLEREGIAVVDDAELVIRDGAEEVSSGDIVLVDDARAAEDARTAGPRGVLSRDSDGPTLAAAIAAVARGLFVADPALVPARSPRPSTRDVEDLTPREHEVLQQLAAGLSNKEIASRLAISEHTVKFHVNALLAKLDAESRTEAVVRGVRLGLVIL